MRIPSPGETELLLPLHDGHFEQPMWGTFLARLRRHAGADLAALMIRPTDGSGVIELHDGTAQGTRLRALVIGREEAAGHRFGSMREGRAYGLDELVELGGDASALDGLTHLRSMRVSAGHALDAWLLLAGERSLGAGTAGLLTALAPHLRVALRTFAAMERERARSSMNADVVRRMNFGWISIDQRCRIVDLDAQADDVLRRSGLLRRGSYDRLTPASARIDRDLTALAKLYAAEPDARPRAIQLSRDPWIDMLVSPLRVRSMASGAQPVAMVYLSGDRHSKEDRCEQLADLFNLSPSEARLAWSMAQGLSIAEAAGEHGLTVETARNYSKKIYAKTGARGQADLVRHILTSVLALA